MSRPILAPLVVALFALLVVPQIQAEPTAPLFVVEQQRSALVSRLAKQWSDAFATLPKERRLDHEQLSNALFALRADRLFAVTLAGDTEAVEAVLADAKREAVKPRVAAKALGDATADLTYTPINPCRILDTRVTPAGPLAPNVARTFDGYSTNFATQGGAGSSCGIPNGVAALAMNVYAVNPTNLGFIKVWPANGTEPDVSTVNYQVGITAIATGTLVPVDSATSNQFTAKSPATVDFIADVVGYFKPPGDATSLDIKVAGQRVMRYDVSEISANLIGGSPANTARPGIRGAVVGGGGAPPGGDPDAGGVQGNRVASVYSTVGGGASNRAGDEGGLVYDGSFATVAGGGNNVATGSGSAIGGGYGNTASDGMATVAGGANNSASGDASVVGGGGQNLASGPYSTIGGGSVNTASGAASTVVGGGSNTASGPWSIVVGGMGNQAAGTFSFAAGRMANAISDGCFVWSDYSLPPDETRCETANAFVARATGGFFLISGGSQAAGYIGAQLASGAGSWTTFSDRARKENVAIINTRAVLERLIAMPVSTWNWKNQDPSIRHIGPVAQDFYKAFGLGESELGISTVDADGVAFAAIQGLNAKLEERLAEKDREIVELKRAVEILLTRTPPDGRVAERR